MPNRLQRQGARLALADMAPVSSFVSESARQRYRLIYDAALATLPPHHSRDVSTDFGSIRALELGTGPGLPVVVLHGMSCTSAMWGPNLEALAADRRVIALDSVVDAGGSTQTAAVADLADVTRSVAQALDGLGVRKAHVVGLSYGAWTAAGLALHERDLVASVSMLEPAMTIHRIKLDYLRGFLASFVRKSPRRWDFLFHRRPADELIALLDSSRSFRPRAPLPGVFSDEQLAAIDVPMQVILGENSTTCDASRTSSRLAAPAPLASIHVVPGAGHIVNVDQPAAVNALLRDFLGRLDAPQ